VVSPWTAVPPAVRSGVLRDTYKVLSSYRPVNSLFPVALFGAVVDSLYGDRAKRAYDLVFNKFDEMLGRQFHERGGERQRGLVITTNTRSNGICRTGRRTGGTSEAGSAS
jgi:hypothetical protein